MTTLRFDGADRRDLLEILIEAVRITEETGERPSLEVGGQLYAGYELVRVAKLLPDDELQDHHAAKLIGMFERPQHEYRRTAFHLAHRVNQIVAANQERRELLRKL